jgi:class III poly(R)-hydroxyalkanoic acid synthase PhaE subunit
VPGIGGFKSYFDWMQQMTSLLPGHHAPPTAPFAGWPMPPNAGPGPSFGLDAFRGLLDMPAFGHTREQQAQQQALMRALLDQQQASARYQELLARAQTQGAERLQRKLAEPGIQIDSLKGMYDLWVDAVEEAYAEIALSDEFREAYAAQTNTQMRVRQLQQKQVEQWCREVGLPTRSEIDSLGQRLQDLRREMRRTRAASAAAPTPVSEKAVKTARRPAAAKATTHPKAKLAAKAKPAAKASTRRAPRKPR